MTFEVRPVGDLAVLLDCGSLGEALRGFEALRGARDRGSVVLDELVPAAETVLVRGRAAAAPGFAARVRELVAGSADPVPADATADAAATSDAAAGPQVAETVIPVVYDGEDLATVAELTGLSIDEVIARHTALTYTAAFTGFAPGFAYLSGGDPVLRLPRRSSPRTRVPAGSVAVAGEFSGVYPRESPGGWQLLGSTDFAMWDLDRDPPAAIVPGARVRFEAVREHVAARGAALPARSSNVRGAAESDGTPVLRIADAGLRALIQDGGRPGLGHLGVSPSGAADRGALESANRMTGNPEHAPALELGFGGFAAEALETTVLALAGARREGRITGEHGARPVPHGAPFRIDPGERLVLEGPVRGLRTMLAVRGGVQVPAVLGSASSDTLAGLGPAALGIGDEVHAGEAITASGAVRADGAAGAGSGIPSVGRPEPQPGDLPSSSADPGAETLLEVVLGPRDDWFDAASLAGFFETSWTVTPRSDRVGVRLAGEPLTRAARYRERELPSEGMIAGSLQVPPDGQPVLFLADHPLTGGYPVIATVTSRGLDLAAQLPPGARVRFARASLDSSDSDSAVPSTQENDS